jgi:membrane protein YdbS with pleckstrin-like domain
MLKYWPQLAASVPSLLLLILAIVRNVFGLDVSFNGVWWLLGANVLLFAACVALALLHPENKAWRYAALFNAWLFVLAPIASVFRFGA